MSTQILRCCSSSSGVSGNRICSSSISKLIKSVLVRGSKKTKRGFKDEGDMLDWFFVPFRSHHTPKEVEAWFNKYDMKSKLLIEKTEVSLHSP